MTKIITAQQNLSDNARQKKGQGITNCTNFVLPTEIYQIFHAIDNLSYL